jgi:PLP dependent protein
MSYAQNYTSILKTIPQEVTLIAVSKTHPIDAIEEVYAIGCRHFGENKVKEMIQKHASLPKDICWHMIGHLQTNKVKGIIPFVHLIHSVDSLKLLSEINKEASKINKIQDCLLQFYIATEETKFGFTQNEAFEMLSSEQFLTFTNVRIRGIMGMASFTENQEMVKAEFKMLKRLFDVTKENYFENNSDFDTISMGMSGDYKLAIQEGSTMIRVGTTIFGNRNYANI